MKRVLLAIAFASMLGAPLAAQEQPPEGEKTTEEMLKELHKLMKEASKEMEEAERELAKASLPSGKADVLAERIKALREKMAKGEIDEVPEGLREYLRNHPEEAAEATGKSADEIKKIAESQDALKELLKKSPELLKKLAQSEEAMEKVLKGQQEAERKLAETLKKQREATEKAGDKVDESINIAQQLRQQGQGKGGKPENNDQKTKDPKDKGDPQNQPGQGKNAEKEYQPGEGKVPPDETKDDYTKREGDGFAADKKRKEMGDGSSSSESGGEPSKYRGMWEKFNREMQKKGKETPRADGDKPK